MRIGILIIALAIASPLEAASYNYLSIAILQAPSSNIRSVSPSQISGRYVFDVDLDQLNLTARVGEEVDSWIEPPGIEYRSRVVADLLLDTLAIAGEVTRGDWNGFDFDLEGELPVDVSGTFRSTWWVYREGLLIDSGTHSQPYSGSWSSAGRVLPSGFGERFFLDDPLNFDVGGPVLSPEYGIVPPPGRLNITSITALPEPSAVLLAAVLLALTVGGRNARLQN